MKSSAVFIMMMIGSAAAFAPASHRTPSTILAASIDEAFGVGIETGNKCPPLGAKLLEDTQPFALKWFQNSEIKHGRIAMMATIGFLVQKLGVHFPLYFGPSGSNAFHPASDSAWLLSSTTGVTFSDVAAAAPLEAVKLVPFAGWLQIFFAIAFIECASYQRQWGDESESDGRVPGDNGYDPLGFTKREGGFESEELKSLRLKEIKNGRLAMVTIAAWVANEAIPGALPVWHP